MYPYPAGSSYILQLLPPDALEGGYDGLVARLAQAEFRERLQLYLEGRTPARRAAFQSVADRLGAMSASPVSAIPA